MKSLATFLAICLAACPLCGQMPNDAKLPLSLGESWEVFLNVEAPESFTSQPVKLQSSGSGMIPPQSVKLQGGSLNLGKLAGTFKGKSIALLYNEFISEKPGAMRIGVSADYWMEVYINGKMVYSTMERGNGSGAYTPDDHVFDFQVKEGRNLLAIKVISGSTGWKFVCGVPSPTLKFEANSEWKAVDMSDVQVKQGSALDLRETSAIPRNSSKQLPRLDIGPSGKLVANGKPLKLNGYSFGTWFLWNNAYKKETIDKLVKLSRIQGYNLFRFGLDDISTKDDMDIDLERLDRVDYLLSQMEEQGIYMHLIIAAGCLYQNAQNGKALFKRRDELKAKMYLGDSDLRKTWKYGTENLMAHVNPYTGLAWKDDPVIACVEFYNEQEIGLLCMSPQYNITPEMHTIFNAKFHKFLESKYGSVEALAKAWGDPSLKSLEQIVAPDNLHAVDARTNDFSLLCNELAKENYDWYETTLRATGYKGLSGQYDLPEMLWDSETRFEKSQVALCHKYFNHPTDQSKPGSKCKQNSSIGDAAGYWRAGNATRFADRPFFVTEHNHAFWNQYQHEGGILFGAYSALQGFDSLVIHAVPVELLVGWPNNAWSVGYSPVARANEMLSACLFLREDVAASPHNLQIEVPEAYFKTGCHAAKAVSTEQDKIGLISGFTISFPWAKRPQGVASLKKADISIAPSAGAEIEAHDFFSDVIATKDAKFQLDSFIAEMKRKGVIPNSNISEPSKGIFQSDTGEITMRAKENLLKVATPRSEAVTLEGGKGESVGHLAVASTSVPALVAACSVDGKELVGSNRIVLIYSTEIANTDMELSGNRVTLIKLGKLPVLMKAGKLNATLKNVNGAKMSLYALGFDGTRREKLPVEFADGLLKVNIDTKTLKDGPTTFFEFAAE